MTGAPSMAQRRATVRRMAQNGASNRQIAAQLGISKDTVRRDLATDDAPPQTLAERLAHRAAQTEAAMSQLSAAAQAVDDASPAYTPTKEETALRWCAELRATAARLMELADQFADYYPTTIPSATRRTADTSAP